MKSRVKDSEIEFDVGVEVEVELEVDIEVGVEVDVQAERISQLTKSKKNYKWLLINISKEIKIIWAITVICNNK